MKPPILFICFFVCVLLCLQQPVFSSEKADGDISYSFLGSYKKMLCFSDELKVYANRYNLERFSKKFGIPSMFDVVLAVAIHESGGNDGLVSYAGARDILQVIPGTRRQMKVEGYREAGVKYLEFLSKRFKKLSDVLKAYHAGPSRVRKGRVPGASYRYAEKVEYYRKLLTERREKIDFLVSELGVANLEESRTWKELSFILGCNVQKLRSHNAYLVYFFPVYIPENYLVAYPVKDQK